MVAALSVRHQPNLASPGRSERRPVLAWRLPRSVRHHDFPPEIGIRLDHIPPLNGGAVHLPESQVVGQHVLPEDARLAAAHEVRRADDLPGGVFVCFQVDLALARRPLHLPILVASRYTVSPKDTRMPVSFEVRRADNVPG